MPKKKKKKFATTKDFVRNTKKIKKKLLGKHEEENHSHRPSVSEREMISHPRPVETDILCQWEVQCCLDNRWSHPAHHSMAELRYLTLWHCIVLCRTFMTLSPRVSLDLLGFVLLSYKWLSVTMLSTIPMVFSVRACMHLAKGNSYAVLLLNRLEFFRLTSTTSRAP